VDIDLTNACRHTRFALILIMAECHSDNPGSDTTRIVLRYPRLRPVHFYGAQYPNSVHSIVLAKGQFA